VLFALFFFLSFFLSLCEVMTVTADHVKKNIADLQTSQMGRTHGASV
jgi:hypothetical protein